MKRLGLSISRRRGTNSGIAEEDGVFTQGKVFSAFRWPPLGLVHEIPEQLPGQGHGRCRRPSMARARPLDRVYTDGRAALGAERPSTDDAHQRVAIDFLKLVVTSRDRRLEICPPGGNLADAATSERTRFDDIQPVGIGPTK